MKKLFLLMCLLTATTVVGQTEDELKALAMEQAQITGEALVVGDYETIFDYTLPAVLEMLGGRETALELVNASFSQMQDQGMKVVRNDAVRLVGFAYEQGQYRCVVENKMFVQLDETTSLDSTNYYFGVYSEEDSRWYFIEANKMKDENVMLLLFPDLVTELNIPDDIKKFIEN